MNSSTGLRFLRPYLCKQQDLPALTRTAYLRFFSSSQSYRAVTRKTATNDIGKSQQKSSTKSDVAERIAELQEARKLGWPRIQSCADAMTVQDFKAKYIAMKPSEMRKDDYLMLRGMACEER